MTLTLISQVKVDSSLSSSNINVILERLQMRNVVWICEPKVNNFKSVLKGTNLLLNTGTSSASLLPKSKDFLARNNVAICAKEVSRELFVSLQNVTFEKVVLVVTNNETLTLKSTAQRRVFYYHENSGKLKEKYRIGQVDVEHLLGHVRNEKFVPTTDKEFLERRSNFYSVSLKMLVATQPPYLFMDKSTNHNGQTTDVFPINSTRLSGSFHDFTEHLQRQMNMTAERFMWTHPDWGRLDPESGKFTGLVGKLMYEDVRKQSLNFFTFFLRFLINFSFLV